MRAVELFAGWGGFTTGALARQRGCYLCDLTGATAPEDTEDGGPSAFEGQRPASQRVDR